MNILATNQPSYEVFTIKAHDSTLDVSDFYINSELAVTRIKGCPSIAAVANIILPIIDNVVRSRVYRSSIDEYVSNKTPHNSSWLINVDTIQNRDK